ncbi:OmpA family protein [Flavobacteriaceae bacterium]|nr:OmpA family protein [Flavobacteriaceae bacterium]MDC1460765.1 OmpA family protein [Flavobacteriaceae bacterium]
MKKTFLTIGIFLSGILSLLGQEDNMKLKSEYWGDYYYMNQYFEKAVDFYALSEDSLSIDTRRNWALALSRLNKKAEAKTQYATVANSVEAQVEDYYIYAGLLFDEKQLALEYRDKSFRLPWSKPSLFQNDSLLFKKRFDEEAYTINSLEGNSESSEFGLVFLTEEEKSTVFYLSEQDKSKASEKAMKRIETDYPIYNFHKGVFDKTSFILSDQEEIKNSINSLFQEGPASFHKASGQLYFTRSADELDKKKMVQLNLYQIQLSDLNQNKTPTALPINVNEFSTMHPSINAAGTELYFASDRPGGFGGMDLYRVTIEDGTFSDPVNLGADINTVRDEVFPFVYSDQFMFYSSNGKEGAGMMDVYLAENRYENRWETHVLGAGINSDEDDFSFGLNENLALGYFASNRKDGQGADDLHAFDFAPVIQGIRDRYQYVPSDTLIVALNHVMVNDQLSLEQQDPLQRLIKKEAELTLPPTFGTLELNKNGSFLYKNTQPTQAKDSFAYRLTSDKGVSEAIWVNLDRALVNKEDLNPILIDAFLPIFYNLDESSILTTYLDRVNKVVAVMQANPTLEVELSSFTDCRGSLKYNFALSDRRTQVIINYIQKRISNPQRIYGKGYGEDLTKTDFRKDFALAAGSFREPKNANIIIDQLRNKGYYPIKQTVGSNVIVLVSQQDSKAEANHSMNELKEIGIDTWIVVNPCIQVSEEEHQQKRRTDFKVIRL